jgi:hypothetical protein
MEIGGLFMTLHNDKLEIFGAELQADTLKIVCNSVSWKLDVFRRKNLE